MKKSSVSEMKNHLSRLLDEVKHGTTILITDRSRPVARLEPLAVDDLATADRVVALVRDGLAAAPRRRFDSGAFLSRPPVPLSKTASAVDVLLAERADGR